MAKQILFAKMKSKKASLLDFFIVLVMIGAMVFVVVSAGWVKTVKVIGDKPSAILSSYAEAEKVLEYLKLAAEISAFREISTCPQFGNDKFKENMKNYLTTYNETNQKLKVGIPNYNYKIETLDDSFKIQGFSEKEISITSELYEFEYKHSGYFSIAADCEKYEMFSGEK